MALFNLAVCYTKGEGVEKDEKKGGRLYNRSGELGFALANTAFIDEIENTLPYKIPDVEIRPIEEYTL